MIRPASASVKHTIIDPIFLTSPPQKLQTFTYAHSLRLTEMLLFLFLKPILSLLGFTAGGVAAGKDRLTSFSFLRFLHTTLRG